MRILIFILTALLAMPVDAEVYVYDYAGYLDTNSLIGSANDPVHGTFSFHTDMPLWYIGGWGEPGDTAYYWDRDVTGLAPHFTHTNDNSETTLMSSEENARIQITNDHYMYGDFFIIYSSNLQSSDISIHPGTSLGISLRGTNEAISSINIPYGLPPLNAFAASHLLVNGSGIGLITSMTWIPPGDLNRDGFVGITDLGQVLANWNQTVPPADSITDPSGDGFIGIEDLNIVLANWNAGTPPSSIVPEPVCAAILSLCFAAIAPRRINR